MSLPNYVLSIYILLNTDRNLLFDVLDIPKRKKNRWANDMYEMDFVCSALVEEFLDNDYTFEEANEYFDELLSLLKEIRHHEYRASQFFHLGDTNQYAIEMQKRNELATSEKDFLNNVAIPVITDIDTLADMLEEDDGEEDYE